MEDVGDVLTSNLSEVVFGETQDLPSVEADTAFRREGSGGCEEAGECEASDAFSATAFADNGKGFTVVEVKRYIANGFGCAGARAEFHGEVIDLEEGGLGHGMRRGDRALNGFSVLLDRMLFSERRQRG